MFKKIIFLSFIIAFVQTYSFAQNQIDALRYSQQFYGATAKSVAMGNSLSAVGADFTAVSINPAGQGVFKKSLFSFSPNFVLSNTESEYAGSIRNENKLGFTFNNLGYVGVRNKKKGALKQLSFGFSYNRLNEYRQDIVATGTNNTGSILDYYTYNANSPYGTIYDDRWSSFRENLAWNTYLMDYDSISGEYFNFVTDDGKYGETQRKSITRKGGSGTYDFTIGANISDILYIGGTLGFTNVYFSQTLNYEETDYPNIYAGTGIPGDSVLANPTNLEYGETLITEGSGVNFKFGMILQPVKFIRIGAAIHSSTFFNMTDEYRTTMYSKFATPDALGDDDYFSDSDYNTFNWKLQTPFRANAGIAFIFDQKEIGKFYTVPMTFSVDYEYVDYSRAHLKSNNFEYPFDNENLEIQNTYGETHTIRAGAEFNFGVIKFRGGYAMSSSPLVSSTDFMDNVRTTYSGGIGIGGALAFMDLGYSYMTSTEILYMYDATNNFPIDPIGNIEEPTANLKNALQFIQLTVGLKF